MTSASRQSTTAARGTVLVAAQGVALGYGSHTVLHAVDLQIRAGEFWFLLGPNGEGKTTFLRAVLGLMSAQAGTLRLDPSLASRAAIGFVPQRCDLNPTLPTTVREFVLLGLVGTGTDRADHAARLAPALDRVGLAGMQARSYWALSGGQRQRALIARALVRHPALLVLDEPTTGLDLAAEASVLEFLAALNTDDGLTVLVVTHDLHLATRYATHAALFHGGTVLAGPRHTVLCSANLTRVYGAPVDLHPGRGGVA